jgi:hypothetical protein
LKQADVSARRQDVCFIHTILVAFNRGPVGLIVCMKLAVHFNIKLKEVFETSSSSRLRILDVGSELVNFLICMQKLYK